MPARRHPRGPARSIGRAEVIAQEFSSEPCGSASSALIPAQAPRFATLDVLRAEHRETDAVLHALERWASHLTTDTARDHRPEARLFVRYLRRFVADWHHAREEGVLFEVLDRVCSSRERGPVAVMLHEHGLLDELVAELDLLVSMTQPWGKTELGRAAEIATKYIDVARRHELKEEAVVYPMVEAKLDKEARSEVVLRLDAFASSEGEGLAELRRLGTSLAGTPFAGSN